MSSSQICIQAIQVLIMEYNYHLQSFLIYSEGNHIGCQMTRSLLFEQEIRNTKISYVTECFNTVKHLSEDRVGRTQVPTQECHQMWLG